MALHPGRAKISNLILLSLPPAVRDEVVRQCERVELAAGQVIYAAADAVQHAYFVDSGVISLVKFMEDGRSAIVAGIGIEGLVGLFTTAHRADRAFADHIVEVPTTAFRIPSGTLHHLTSKHEALNRAIVQYLLLSAELLVQVSACNRLHLLEQRCCHWLLVAHDNAFADQFHLTHEFLAALLGVERSSVSATAGALQRRGSISYSHGRVSVVDRAALESTACECYRARRNLIAHAFETKVRRLAE